MYAIPDKDTSSWIRRPTNLTRIFDLSDQHPEIHAAIAMYGKGEVDWEEAMMLAVTNLAYANESLIAKIKKIVESPAPIDFVT